MRFSVFRRLISFWILTLLSDTVAKARAASSSRPAILYSWEETGTTSDDYVLFRSVFSELKRLLEAYKPKAKASGLHFFKSKPNSIPSSKTSLATHLFEPDDSREAWELLADAPFSLGGEGIFVSSSTDPDSLAKADITHKKASNGVSEILDKLLNYSWPAKAAPLIHIIFTDGVPHFRGYNKSSPYDEQPVLWGDLMSSHSGYPSLEDAKAKVESSPVLDDYMVLVFAQVTNDKKDTRQAWEQGLHAMGLDGRFSVNYLHVENSNKVQAEVLTSVKEAISAHESGSKLPVPDFPTWPETVTSTTSSTSSTTSTSTTSSTTSTTSTSTTSSTTSSSTTSSTTSSLTTSSTTSSPTTSKSITSSTTESVTTHSTSSEPYGNTVPVTVTTTVTPAINTSSTAPATSTSATDIAFLPGVSRDVGESDTSKIVLGAASVGVAALLAAAAFHLWGPPSTSVDTSFDEAFHEDDAHERDTLVRVTDFVES
eukprot:Blabericola_migrator_1__11578@NODE_693_length_6845_cov_22_269549_g503_i0_p3_GENE_NODE_693_length_6845_cov_22_269549_g503_i0NODE_693_length_6845_cov_22_269549_g503_i0_p3_ORF_typecomplete_len484_score70_93Mucin15/PF15672_5/0_00018Macoilin/PF09726_9/0_001Hamartin/PF04388_12/0_0015KAR9/PF08580_10/0_072SBE2/PF17076_5/0_16Pol_alpha_B_N/PF08418_10/3_3MSP1_C/PF07462_11/11_NODE_693_length_6845_cov_22_269549_g503_i019243375